MPPPPELDDRYDALIARLRALDRLAVAVSGGVDSALLLAAAAHALGNRRVLALTAAGPIWPRAETAEATALASRLGVPGIVCELDPFDWPGFRNNPPDRCYICKRGLLTAMLRRAREAGFETLAHGENADDAADYRPGARAAEECGALAPLRDAGLTKADIRALSRRLGLPTSERPAMACLASRFPYGVPIEPAALRAVETVEAELHDIGFTQVRVRHHGSVARIEVPADEFGRFADKAIRERLSRAAREAGYLYVAADLDGYRTGSLNAALRKQEP